MPLSLNFELNEEIVHFIRDNGYKFANLVTDYETVNNSPNLNNKYLFKEPSFYTRQLQLAGENFHDWLEFEKDFNVFILGSLNKEAFNKTLSL